MQILLSHNNYKKLFMSNNYNFTPKQYEANQRYPHKITDINSNKPKPRESLPMLPVEQFDNSSEYIRTIKQQSSTPNGSYFLNYKYSGQKSDLSQKNNLSNYDYSQKIFQKSKFQTEPQFYYQKNNNDQMQSAKSVRSITMKYDINQYNSAKYINNKIDLTPNNIDQKFSAINVPNNLQINRHQRKKSNWNEDNKYNQQFSAQLFSNAKKSNSIISQPQNNLILNKKSFFQNQQKKNQIQTIPKKMPRYSEPGIFSNECQLNKNDDTVSQFRSPHTNQNRTKLNYYANINQYSKSNNNQEKKFSQNQLPNTEAFKKQKQLKDQKQTISTMSTANSITKTRIKSQQRSFIFQNFQKQHLKLQHFIKGKELGSGKFGTVSVVSHKKSGFVCAMKKIPKNMIKEENIVNQFIRQLKIQSYLDHPNITKLYGFFDDKDFIYLLLQLGSEGQLYKMLKQKKRLAENMVIYIVRQLCDALKYLHSLNIIHRDIKPQNIVLQYGTIKLCDFGWAVHKGSQLRSTFCGTPLYVSPQILQGQQYDQKIDVWSVGILTYELLVGQIPFEITTQQQLIKIIKQDIVFPKNLNISNEAKDFIFKILKRNPDERLKIGKLLEHPFLKRNIQGSQINL